MSQDPVSRREAAARLGALALGRPLLELQAPASGSPQDTPGSASPLSDRSPFERITRAHSSGISSAPLHRLHGTLTPSDLHYEVHHSGIPAIDPAQWQLVVHGRVRQPKVFTLSDLKALPAVSRTCFIECSGNYPRNAAVDATPQVMAGLTSQSEWTGVPLRVLFNEVGVSAAASWFLAEGGDRARLDRSIPVAKGLDDAMLAYAQNGEPLRPAQGYPVRLLLPGWEGNANVKWLRRIEFGTEPFMTRWETSRYSDGLPDGKIRQFSFEIDARSIITHPAPPDVVRRGWICITGIAWSGRGRITRVELSMDGGRRWTDAQLDGPVLSKAHTRFSLMWQWDGAERVIMSRAIDDTGYVQPTLARLIEVRGLNTGPYHLNPIIGWRLPASGRMELHQERWG